jgi:hypothetical protein
MTSQICEGQGCRRRDADLAGRQRADAGSRLCPACREWFVAGLTELPTLYEECGRVLGGGSPAGPRERTTGGSLPGLPFNGAAAQVRAAIVATLGSWSGLVAEERLLSAPGRTAGRLASFLLANADWLAAHSAAAEATDEVERLVRAARRVAHPDPVRRIRLGHCVRPGCGGELNAYVRAQQLSRAEIQCDADPNHNWAGHQWTQLRRDLHPAIPDTVPERWLTAADISRLWNAPVGTIYRLASEQQWRRKNRAGRTYYSEADAHECFRRRAARSA